MYIVHYKATDGPLKRSFSSFDIVEGDTVTPFEYVGHVGQGGKQEAHLFAPTIPSNMPLLVRHKSEDCVDQLRQSANFRRTYPSHFSQSIAPNPEQTTSRMVSTFFQGVNIETALRQTGLLSTRWKRLGLYVREVAAFHKRTGSVHLDLCLFANALFNVESDQAILLDPETMKKNGVSNEQFLVSVSESFLLYLGDLSFRERYQNIKKALGSRSGKVSYTFTNRYLWIPSEASFVLPSDVKDVNDVSDAVWEEERTYKISFAQDVFAVAADILYAETKDLINLSDNMRAVINRARNDDPSCRPALQELIASIDLEFEVHQAAENRELRLKCPDVTENALAHDCFREILHFVDVDKLDLLNPLLERADFNSSDCHALARLAVIGSKDLFNQCLASNDNDNVYTATNALMRLNLKHFPKETFQLVLNDQSYCNVIGALSRANCLITGPHGEWFLDNFRVFKVLYNAIQVSDFASYLERRVLWLSLMKTSEEYFPCEEQVNMTLEQFRTSLDWPDSADVPDLFFEKLLAALRVAYVCQAHKEHKSVLFCVLDYFCDSRNRDKLDDATILTMQLIRENDNELELLIKFAQNNEEGLFIDYLNSSFSSEYLRLLKNFEDKKASIFLDLCRADEYDSFLTQVHQVFFDSRACTMRLQVLNYFLEKKDHWDFFKLDIKLGPFDDFYAAMAALIDQGDSRILDVDYIAKMLRFQQTLTRFLKQMTHWAILPRAGAWRCGDLTGVALGIFLYLDQHNLMQDFNKNFWVALFAMLSTQSHLAHFHSSCIEIVNQPENSSTKTIVDNLKVPASKMSDFKNALRLGVVFGYSIFEPPWCQFSATADFFQWLSKEVAFCQSVYDWLSTGLEYGAWTKIHWDIPEEFSVARAKQNALFGLEKAKLEPVVDFQNARSLFVLMGNAQFIMSYYTLIFSVGGIWLNKYVNHFSRIYLALEQGESSFFKKRELQAESIIEERKAGITSGTWEACLTFSEQNPLSRTACALTLAARFPGQSPALIKHIYALSYLHSGRCCRSSLAPALNTFFKRPSQVKIDEALVDCTIDEQTIQNAKPSSRLGCIRTALRG
jgi:hypothetical protein